MGIQPKLPDEREWRVVFHIPTLPKMHVMWVIWGSQACTKRGMSKDIPCIEVGHFYPNLAQVGKDVLSKERTV